MDTVLAGDPHFSFLRPPDRPGEFGRLGHYRLVSLLGQGGMGYVFKAFNENLLRPCALKIMRPDVAAKPESRARFLREARGMAAVRHPHVVPVHHIGEDNGVPFIEMPLLEGESLATRLAREQVLPPTEVARIGREIAEGLAAAHAQGIVHRDIKPENVWLAAPAGSVIVLDFGLARSADGDDGVSQPGAIVGTPAYMAPEQAVGGPVDARADLFSLGCLLYHLATGRKPFEGPTVMSVLTRLATHEPPPASEARAGVPPALSTLIVRLMTKDLAGRPASASAVAAELRGVNDQDETRTLPPTTIVRPRPRRALPLLGGVAAMLAVGLAAGVFLWPRTLTGPATPTAPTEPAALRGDLDILLTRMVGGRTRELRLGDPDALPLQVGDQFAVDAELSRPSYAYVLWIDTDGRVQPLYPWRPGHWEDRPAVEKPVTRLRRPEAVDQMYEVELGTPGMETLVLLARETPLPADVDVRGLLGELPKQTEADIRAAAWFENGMRVNDGRANRARFDEKPASDPVLRTQGRIASALGPKFEYTRSVSFANRGK